MVGVSGVGKVDLAARLLPWSGGSRSFSGRRARAGAGGGVETGRGESEGMATGIHDFAFGLAVEGTTDTGSH